MIPVTINNTVAFQVHRDTPISEIKAQISDAFNLKPKDFYLVHNGKLLSQNIHITNKIDVVFRINGGKGGFGSMLRAIGAQIEKTTNREACRDLSGRRLRDINEEKRLKKWIEQQAEREKEAADRKQKKLEKLCEQPKFEFKDEAYDRMRSELPEIIGDSVSQGMKKASEIQIGGKRKNEDNGKGAKKKKKLWLDDDLEDLDTSSEDSESDDKPESEESNSRGSCEVGEASCSSASCSGKEIESKVESEMKANEGVVENVKTDDLKGKCEENKSEETS